MSETRDIVIVVGDIILDIYKRKLQKLSPEAPVAILEVEEHYYLVEQLMLLPT